jgi:hypothetical protein
MILALRACSFQASNRRNWIRFLPLAVLPLLTAALELAPLPRWVFMWLVCAALFAGCKWLTYWPERRARGSLIYLLLWPGMNAKRFLRQPPLETNRGIERVAATLKMLLGAALIWRVARLAYPFSPLLAGWTGMVGIVLLFHCGVVHFLALCWRRAGFGAAPIMQSPVYATSLSEFWGVRWNRGFSDLTREFIFRPLFNRIRCGGVALLACFAISGLVHELVISLPARAGFGLPTAYFCLQGCGQLFERSTVGKRLGLAQGWRGWLFTMICTAGPAVWMAHPPFVHAVIIPFMRAIGAL